MACLENSQHSDCCRSACSFKARQSRDRVCLFMATSPHPPGRGTWLAKLPAPADFSTKEVTTCSFLGLTSFFSATEMSKKMRALTIRTVSVALCHGSVRDEPKGARKRPPPSPVQFCPAVTEAAQIHVQVPHLLCDTLCDGR